MSFPNAPPVSASLGDFSIFKPDFPDEGQQSVGGEVESLPPAPTGSTEFIGDSQQPFPEQSINSLQVVNSNGDDLTNNRSSTNIWSKTVKQLRLSEALTLPETTSIYDARCQMAAERAAVLVLTDSNALITGILTNKDFSTRVIGHEIDLVKTPVSTVMTKNPNFVQSDTLVVEALQTMAQGKFRQLPVVENGKVIGLVRPMLCLFDEMGNKGTTAENYDKVIEAAMQKRVLTVKQVPKVFCCMVPETTTIYEAFRAMGHINAYAAAATDSNELVSGILTKKDIVSRVIPCGTDVMNTPISKVMTKKPFFVRCNFLPMEVVEKIVQGKAIQLLVNEDGRDDYFDYLSLNHENGRDKRFDYLPLNLCGGVLPTTQKNVVNVNGNSEFDETNYGPGFSPFDQATNSPYPNITPSFPPFEHVTNSPFLNFPPPQHTAVGPAERTTAAAPGFSPFVHMTNSPTLGEFVVPPPQYTAVGPPGPGANGNLAWNGTAAPGFSPFVRAATSPYLNDPPPQHTAVGPAERTTAAAPGFSPFVHMTNSPTLGQSVVPPPQYTAVGLPGNPVLGVDGNRAWDGTAAPGFTPFVHATTSPYINATPSGSSTNIGGLTEEKTVKQLQLSKALTMDDTATIYEACCQMAAQNVDALVLMGSSVLMTGILSYKDIVRRVIAGKIDLMNTPVKEVMTKNPSFMTSDTVVVKAQQRLLTASFKQYPVMENGKVIGFFDRTQTTALVKHSDFFDIYSRGSTMKQLPLQNALILPETTTIYEACCQMVAGRVEVVVLTNSNADFLGILTKKDIVSRIIPSGIDVVNTPVSKVMRRTVPIFVSCDTFPPETIQKILGQYLQSLSIENDEDNGLVYQMLSLHK